MLKSIIICIFFITLVKCYTIKNVTDNDGYEDKGISEPLYLTKYIEKGQLEKARILSRVKPLVDNVKSYSGYITVNKKYNSNLFFWYFQSENDPKNDPTVIWLQGGPGASSLLALFNEHGPYIITRKNIIKRKYTWSKICNIIYIDNPVGTGYSFTDNELGYATNQTQVGNDLYEALIQILQLFPDLRKNNLFITGESYGGKYVPAFGYAILKNNNHVKKPKFFVNLKGLMIGNGLTDPLHMFQYGEYLYQLGLIDDNIKNEINKSINIIEKKIEKHEWLDAARSIDQVLEVVRNNTGLTSFFNYINPKSGDWEDYEEKFVTSNQFKNIIHVGNKKYNNGTIVYKHLEADIPKSVINWVVELLKHYKVLFYNGQLDIICAYPLTENVLKNMKWSHSEQYKKAKRHIFKVNGNIAGYYKTVGNLTEVLIRNAGHMVPTDQPIWALRLLHDFVHNKIKTDNSVDN